jgi:hypothetical protein
MGFGKCKELTPNYANWDHMPPHHAQTRRALGTRLGCSGIPREGVGGPIAKIAEIAKIGVI